MATIDQATEKEILAAEKGLQDALMKPDLDWFSKNWTPDASYVHMSGGVDGREGFIDRLRTKATVYRSRNTGDVKMRRYGDAVVVTGTSDIVISVNGGADRQLPTRFTRVYVKENGHWLLAANQSGGNTPPKA